jgi:ATP-dependent Clp protease protease subunit
MAKRPREKSEPTTLVVPIFGEVTTEHVQSIHQAVLEAQKGDSQLRVSICSVGGSVAAGVGIYDLLRSCGSPVRTEVWGECLSIAVLILMAGDVRAASRNSQLMLHDSAAEVSGSCDTNDVKTLYHRLKSIDQEYDALVSKRSKTPIEQVRKWSEAETYFSASEALKYGLIDEIIDESAR